jgi:osmotically inducible lipoprotein OsmB
MVLNVYYRLQAIPIYFISRRIMKITQKVFVSAVAISLLFSLSACAGMSHRDKNTAIGAGVGAVGGAVLTGGSALGTVGGAAVGGLVGHSVR